MINKEIMVRFLMSVAAVLLAGSGISASAHEPRMPVPLPVELTDTKPFDEDAWQRQRPYNSAWGSTSVHYPRLAVPTVDVSADRVRSLSAWKGERVNALALLWSPAGADSVEVTVSDLKGPGRSVIPADCISSGFLHYVMTDQVNPDGRTACGNRPDHSVYDSSMVADAIDTRRFARVAPRTTQPVWISVDVPRDIREGVYRGRLSFKGAPFRDLEIAVKVGKRTLPTAHERSFWLDLWQHPYSVARYYNVPLWSDAHFDAMRDTYEPLAAIGQKCITVPIIHKPWNGQTEDHFESMIGRTRELDGSWTYNYDVFDRWVEFMMSLGIDREINCYSMLPWNMAFRYYDRASDSMQYVVAKQDSEEYRTFWLPFLKDFAAHLKDKGWFEITNIAMDERPMQAMQGAIKVLKEADPDFRVSLAGLYHQPIESDIDDYCIALGGLFPEDVLGRRRAEGKRSTVYTCCAEAYPNTFTCSPPEEAVWLGWYAAAADFDGYLRWAYNSWVAEPLQDSRFRSWAAGDTYMIYPGGRSSVRLEKLNEGIQDYEKIMILRKELADNPAALKRLNGLLTGFDRDSIPTHPVSDWLPARREALNRF